MGCPIRKRKLSPDKLAEKEKEMQIKAKVLEIRKSLKMRVKK
jgi:hypothetical protein